MGDLGPGGGDPKGQHSTAALFAHAPHLLVPRWPTPETPTDSHRERLPRADDTGRGGCLSLSVSLRLCPSLSVCLCLSLSVHLCPSLFVSVCLSPSLSVSVCPSLSLCLSLCLSLSLSACLSLERVPSLSLCLCLSISVSSHTDDPNAPKPVSYTHLTLPTNSLV